MMEQEIWERPHNEIRSVSREKRDPFFVLLALLSRGRIVLC